MIKRILILFFILISLFTGAQNWASVSPQSFNCAFLESILIDSVHDELIVSSKFFTQVGSLPARGVARWNGIKWDSLTGGINTHDKNINPNNPSANIVSCIPYNGRLLVGGGFSSIGGINAPSLALWDGAKWDSLPKRAFSFSNPVEVWGFIKKNSLLYIYGDFTAIAGQPTSHIGTWDGSNFAPVNFPFPTGNEVLTAMEYKNEIYFGGRFYNSTTDSLNKIVRFDGTKFRSVGGGFLGSYDEVWSMAIYNNELYVSGHIDNIGGNATGEHVMKWDGSQWHSVGFGVGNSMASSVLKLLVHNNKLFAFGYFQYAAGIPCFNAAVYDGVKWCAMKDTIGYPINGATIFRDSIYIAGGFSLTTTPPIYQTAKLKDENLYRDCNGVGINELKNNDGVRIYPNPVLNILHIESEQYFEAGSEIEIVNTLGQPVLKLSFNKEIDVSKLAAGYYILKLINPDNQQIRSRFIKD
jgi:hypothetical protein